MSVSRLVIEMIILRVKYAEYYSIHNILDTNMGHIYLSFAMSTEYYIN